ncbi:hypothetical protein DL96DRAFT_353774 [Flagelloscypha sp. PMI_526]|nr:hypothetical protein DL96DRAFT_353774 [Flagelloscypha sp. PMI_526]
MHRLWSIAELQDEILPFCTSKAAVSLGLTTKSLLERALNHVWSQVQLERLIECLPRDVWYKLEDMNGEMMGLGWYWCQKRALAQEEFDRMLYYSRRVHIVTFDKLKWVDGLFFRSPDGKQPPTLFPQLHTASLFFSNPVDSSIKEVMDPRLFFGTSMSSLTLNLSRALSSRPTGPYALFLLELGSISPNLRQLHLSVDEWNGNSVMDILSQAIPSCRLLESFKVDSPNEKTAIISRKVLQFLANLETITELRLPFVEFPQDLLFAPTSLQHLHLKPLGPRSLSGLRNLTFLRIDNASKCKKFDIAPMSLPSLKQCWVSGDPSFCAMLVEAADGAPLTNLILRMEASTSDRRDIPLAQMLASIGRSSSLERLTLKGSAKSSHIIGLEDFLALGKCSNLVKLQIRYDFRLDDANWDTLLPCWPALEILKLGWKNHGDTSLRVFEAIQRHSPSF